MCYQERPEIQVSVPGLLADLFPPAERNRELLERPNSGPHSLPRAQGLLNTELIVCGRNSTATPHKTEEVELFSPCSQEGTEEWKLNNFSKVT